MGMPIASYLPDSQLIKLRPDFAAFSDPENHRGFVGPHEIAYIFHEWIHYLHNVSTIHGLSSFTNFVHLWTNFRWTICADGLSGGSTRLPENEQLSTQQKLTLMAAVRRHRKNDLPQGLRPHQVRVASVRVQDDAIPMLAETTRTIILTLKISNADGDEETCSVEIGNHEIVESVAYMLEERLTKKLGENPVEPSLTPYFLLRILASYLARSLDDQCILICGLTSLQETDPVSSLIQILEEAEREKSNGSEMLPFFANQQAMRVNHVQEFIDKTLCEVDSIFPLDEPMARAVRNTTQTIRRNFDFRRGDPFFELSLIDRIAACPSSLNEILGKHGACAIMQQRQGGENDVQRDIIYDFVVRPEPNEDLHQGQRIMHAAFHFISLHVTRNNDLLATSQLCPKAATKCPFYTVCDQEMRQRSPETCTERPWLTALPEMPSLCWYGQAIKKIGPSREVVSTLESSADVPTEDASG